MHRKALLQRNSPAGIGIGQLGTSPQSGARSRRER